MRILTVGIDGGTFKTLDPMMKLGVMPKLRDAMSRGSFAIAESVIPTNSAAAWSSIMTGMNPGKHGVFYFNELDRTRAGPKWGRLVNFNAIHGETLWRVLGEYGLRVCVINVPITFPPEPVNGILISGLLAPSESSNFTYPPELKNELLDYKIDINLMDEQRPDKEDWYNHILREVIEITKHRNLNVLRLLQKEKWDFVMVVYRETDDVQHFLWHIISEGFEQKESSPYFSKVKEYFSVLDSSINEVICMMGSDTNTFVISDHGFDAMPSRMIDLDAWARSRRLQYFRSGYAQARIALIGILRSIIANQKFGNLVNVIAQHRTVSNSLEFGVVKKKDNLIDWGRTRAFKFGDGLAINSNEIDVAKADSLKDAIRRDLISIRDSQRVASPILDVIRREELYSGGFASRAPDLIIVPSPSYKLGTIPGIKILEDSPKTELTGDHDRSGIFMAFGPDIKTLGRIQKVSILDFFPTILQLFEINGSPDLDGRVLQPILKGSSRMIIRAKVPQTPLKLAQGDSVEFTNSEEEDLRERLSRLGYL